MKSEVFIIAPYEPALTVRLTMDEYCKVAQTLNASPVWIKQLENRERILLVPAGGLYASYTPDTNRSMWNLPGGK